MDQTCNAGEVSGLVKPLHYFGLHGLHVNGKRICFMLSKADPNMATLHGSVWQVDSFCN